MQHPDEGTIHAWLDGALSSEDASALELHVAECSECAGRVAEARGLIAASSRLAGALDDVPSGVIPDRSRARQPWYSRGQLRAAAAVLLVASASLLVVRKELNAPQPQRAVATMQSRSEAAEPEESGKANVPAPVTAAKKALPPAAKSSAAPLRQKEIAASTTANQVRSGNEPSVADAVAAPSIRGGVARVEQRDRSTERRIQPVDTGSSRATLGQVVVTGVATATSPQLKQLRADTTASGTTTVFEVSPGVEVTLVERNARGFAPLGGTRITGRTAVTAPPAPQQPVAANAEAKAATTSITWVDALGRVQTLTGPLAKAQLDSIRQLLPPDKR